MLGLRRALRLAKKAGAEKAEVEVEDLERFLEQSMEMDRKLAECMSRLSKQDYQAVFGEMFADAKAD
jgi:hypothetical protein